MARNRSTRLLTVGLSVVVLLALFLGLVSPVMFDARAQAPAEGTWAAQASGTSRRLLSVFFFDVNNGWIVGEGGTILRTSDGGAAWTGLDSGIVNTLRGVFFLTREEGWVAGDGGYIARTSNGGVTWNKLESGTSAALYAIRFKDINTGWVVGDNGVIFETNNGGVSWTREISGNTHLLRSLIFVDALNYWTAGDSGTFVRTEDGAASWLTQPAVATQGNLESVHFASPTVGWAVGTSGVALNTVDGGRSWTKVVLPTSSNFHSVFFPDVNNGWIAADVGTLLVTKDGGRNWEVRFLGVNARLNSLYFADRRNGWAVGDGGAIFKYTLIETVNPADFSLSQDISEDGRVSVSLRIDALKNPATGQPRQALRGIAGVKASMNYEEGFAILDFRGVAPFDKPDIRVNNVGGVATYEGLQREAEPQAPLVLGRFFPKVTGSAAKKLTVTIRFSSIVEGGGNEMQSKPVLVVFRRGDAKADGTIDANDAAVIARFLAGQAKKDELDLVNAASAYPDSADGDKITIKDAMFLAQKVAGVRNDEFNPASVFWADMLRS